MTEILSYGNLLRCGTYEMHSRFSSVVNFIAGDNLVSVVHEKIGGGPLNIVAKGIVTDSIASLEVHDHLIILNGKEISLDESKRYNPFLNFNRIDFNKLKENLPHFEKVLIELAQEDSLAFFLSHTIEITPQSTFRNILKRKLYAGLKELQSGDFEKGAAALKGVGIGLTPGGDDAIAGALIALHLMTELSGWDLKQSISRISEIAVSQNKFTNSFLYCASQGMLFEKNKNLIQSLLSGNATDIKENVAHVLEIGHTSGTDMAVGFLVVLKRMMSAFDFAKIAV
jgi:hypothetical protein